MDSPERERFNAMLKASSDVATALVEKLPPDTDPQIVVLGLLQLAIGIQMRQMPKFTQFLAMAIKVWDMQEQAMISEVMSGTVLAAVRAIVNGKGQPSEPEVDEPETMH